MKNRKILAFYAAIALAATGVVAQDDPSSQSSDTNSNPSGGSSLSDSNSASSAESRATSRNQASSPMSSQQRNQLKEAQQQEFFKASEITGKSCKSSNGEDLGDIQDVVFNQKGEIFAFIALSGDRIAAVPWQLVNAFTAKGKGDVTVNTTKQQLQSAPTIAKNQWGALNNPSFAKGIYGHFQVQSPSSSAMGGSSGSEDSSSSSGSSLQSDESSSSSNSPSRSDQ